MMNFEEYKKKSFDADPKLKHEYDDLAPQYDFIKEIIEARTAQNLTQKQLSEITGVKQSNISRLESGSYNPSLEFMQKIAKGLGKQLRITLE